MSVGKITTSIIKQAEGSAQKIINNASQAQSMLAEQTEVASKAAADASRAYSLTDIRPIQEDSSKLFTGRHNNKPIPNKEKSPEFEEKIKELKLDNHPELLATQMFRIPKDLVFIDEIVTNAILSGKKIKIAHIGLGSNGIEPLTHLAQIQLTAKKFGKSIDDVLEKVDYIDIQKASDIKHRAEMLERIEKDGIEYFQNLGEGFTKEDKKTILEKFDSFLKKSDTENLGKSYEDFIDAQKNHNQYDIVSCNNVFYYVGKGEKGSKYCYSGSKFMGNCMYDERYAEVITNLLSTLKKNGKLFYTNQPGINKKAQDSIYTDLMDSIIQAKKLPFRKISQDNNTVYERIG